MRDAGGGEDWDSGEGGGLGMGYHHDAFNSIQDIIAVRIENLEPPIYASTHPRTTRYL